MLNCYDQLNDFNLFETCIRDSKLYRINLYLRPRCYIFLHLRRQQTHTTTGFSFSWVKNAKGAGKCVTDLLIKVDF